MPTPPSPTTQNKSSGFKSQIINKIGENVLIYTGNAVALQLSNKTVCPTPNEADQTIIYSEQRANQIYKATFCVQIQKGTPL